MRILRVLFGFFIGQGNAWLWNVFVYILCVVPTALFVKAIQHIEDPAWAGGLGSSALLVILAFALMVDCMILASSFPGRNALKYPVALAVAGLCVLGCYKIGYLYNLRTRSSGQWVVFFTLGSFFLHLSLVQVASSLKNTKRL